MLQHLQCRLRGIHAGHLGGAGTCRLQPPRADVAEHVQHLPVLYILVQCQPVAALVEEPAGLLAAGQRHLETHPALFQHDAVRHLPDQLRLLCQAFQCTYRAVVAQQQAGRLDDALQHLDYGVAHTLHAGRGDLHHQHLAVTVHHQPRQAVAFAKYQPVVRRIKQPLAQFQRRAQPPFQQAGVKLRVGAPAEQACTDQRMRVDIRRAQQLARCCLHIGKRACLEACQRRAPGVHFIAVDPDMPGLQAALFVLPEDQAREPLAIHGLSVCLVSTGFRAVANRVPPLQRHRGWQDTRPGRVGQIARFAAASLTCGP